MNSSACSTFKTAAFTSAAFACSAFACSTLNRASQALAQSAAQLSAHASFSVSVVAVALCAAWPLMSNAQGTSARVTEIEVSNGVRKPDTQAVPGSFNRLKVGTVVEFDKRTRSVGEAMSLLLAPMRYRVTNRTVDAAAAASIMRRPLPVSAMDAGVMSIESALLLLIGDENRLVVDHRNRLVAVERTPPESQGLSKGQPRSQPLASLPKIGRAHV